MSQDVNHGPREALEDRGCADLTDLDLMTVILSPGTRDLPGRDLAKLVLERAGPLSRMAQRRPAELAAIPGLGQAKSCRLLAGLELGRRTLVAQAGDAPRSIKAAHDVYRHCASLAVEPVEVFVVMGLNSRNRIVGQWEVARGWESGVNLLPRQVFSLILKEGVGRVVFVHNHPSGDPTPSPEDVRFTARLLEVARMLDVRVVDHVVVAAEGHVSLREHAPGRLEFG
jgi:DNA repair protein RadC